MQFNAAQIAELVNGKVEGNGDVIVSSFGKIENAQKGQLTFLSNPKYEEYLYTTKASVLLINETQEVKKSLNGTTLIRVPDAYSAFATILSAYQNIMTENLTGIEQPAYISSTAKVGKNVFIGAFAYVSDDVLIGDNVKIFPQTYLGKNVTVGSNTIIYAGVKIYHDCTVGKNVIIHSGTVIGSDGFGFAPLQNGAYQKISQIGNVVIENDVEIGSNTTIDRATMGSTIIKNGAKLDNLIQIGHNAEVGENTVIAAQAGISGSTKIGSKVMVGGQAGFVGHIKIADGTMVGGQAKITKTISKTNSAVNDSPAFEYKKSIKAQAVYRNLPEMERRLREMEEFIKKLYEKFNLG